MGSSFSGSRTTPLRLPAPRRGWSCGAGPLNPRRTGGRLAGAGVGWGERPGAQWPAAHPARRGAGAARRRGGAGWGGVWARVGAGTAAWRPRVRAHTLTRTRARAGTHTSTRCSAAPGPAAPTPGAIGEIKGGAERLHPFISGAQGKRPLSAHRMTPCPEDPPAKAPHAALYTSDSGRWLASPPLPGAQGQRVWAVAGSKVNPGAGLAVLECPGHSRPPAPRTGLPPCPLPPPWSPESPGLGFPTSPGTSPQGAPAAQKGKLPVLSLVPAHMGSSPERFVDE